MATKVKALGHFQSSVQRTMPRPCRQFQSQLDNKKRRQLGNLASAPNCRYFAISNTGIKLLIQAFLGLVASLPPPRFRQQVPTAYLHHGRPVASAAVSPSDQLICSTSCGGVIFMNEAADRPDHPDQALLAHLGMERPDTW